MGDRLFVEPHLSVDELFERYRSCTETAVKPHWHVLWLKAKGFSSRETSEATGFKPDWVRRLVHRYNRGGPEAIRNYVKDNGRQGYLSDEQKAELMEILKVPPPDGGLWSGPKVARWIAEKIGVESVCPQTGWEYLCALGFTLQRPRPRHPAARPDGQTWLKKRSGATERRSRSGSPKPR